ncbi:hypothetical protein BDW74DRAFT_163842 [Aspergillus multicolor]|uniref:uncharacterized protein n=1 Tax=Aspergillus multicolor TaxID=41759 RepID=UPI003CCD2339
MPRLKTRIILEAYKIDRLLPLLVRECRALDSARNELRWLREQAQKISTKHASIGWRRILKSMCRSRSRGVPLQYILGDQPFGELDIKCTKGVLIPRHETETITFHTANLILDSGPNALRFEERPLRILDLCTGTGCISLLLHALLSPHFSHLSIVGVDISDTAIKLAKENAKRNVRLGTLSERALTEVSFQRSNVLEFDPDRISSLKNLFGYTPNLPTSCGSQCDILISNPPYISLKQYHDGTTSRSVRTFEPKLALVPPEHTRVSTVGSSQVRHEDTFYCHIARLVSTFQAKLTILECGSRSQGLRVAALCKYIIGRRGTLSGQVLIDVWSATDSHTGPTAVIIHNNGLCNET